MLSKSLLKKTLKDNWKFWLGITIALALMLAMMVFMASSFLDRMAADMPGGGRVPMGATDIISQYYTMFAVMLPLIYIVITGNKLVAAQVDKGSMAYIMSKPVKRNQVSLTQATYLIGSVAAMFSVIMLVGMAMVGVTGVEINMGAFVLLNLGILLFHLAISGISYMASCIFSSSGKSLLVGAGIPVLFFVFSMLAGFSNMADWMGFFKYLSLNTLYDTTAILAFSTNMIWQFLILFAVAAGCYMAGILYFKKKDLPL